MPRVSDILGTPIWQGLGAIFTLVGILVGVYLVTRDIIWLLLILWGFLLIVAIFLCLTFRERVMSQQTTNQQITNGYFYSMCISIGLICSLLGLSFLVLGDLRATIASPSTATSTPTFIPTPTSTSIPIPTSTSTPTATVTQGDLLETWAYSTRMWEAPALMYPNVELSVESEPNTHPSYAFEYHFPSTITTTFAAFNFELVNTPDLSAYTSVRIKFKFSNDGTNCYFGLSDNEQHTVRKSLGGVGTNDWTTITFPLDSTFPGVNRRAITQVTIFTDNPGDGSVHKCTINEIRFFKP